MSSSALQKAYDILCTRPEGVPTLLADAYFESTAVQVNEAELLAHIKALCFDTEALGLPSGRVWHFEPREFITHFRKCGWLSQREVAALLPRNVYTGYPGSVRNTTITWDAAFSRWTKYTEHFNRCCNKYLILSPERRSIFLGQIYTETMLVQTVTELGKGREDPRRGWISPAMEFYQVFYGRGMMQLTWPENYQKYGKFQGSIPLPDLVQGIQYSDNRISRVSLHYWSDPRKKRRNRRTGLDESYIDESLNKIWSPRFDPDVISINNYFSVDSAGFYWVSKSHRNNRTEPWMDSINRVCDLGISNESVGRCSVLVNGGGNQYFERQGYTRYIYKNLSNSIESTLTETISVNRNNRNVNVTIDYTRQS